MTGVGFLQTLAQAADKRVSIIKIYVKDFSFESPQAPGIFQTKEGAPQTSGEFDLGLELWAEQMRLDTPLDLPLRGLDFSQGHPLFRYLLIRSGQLGARAVELALFLV